MLSVPSAASVPDAGSWLHGKHDRKQCLIRKKRGHGRDQGVGQGQTRGGGGGSDDDPRRASWTEDLGGMSESRYRGAYRQRQVSWGHPRVAAYDVSVREEGGV